MLSKIYLMKKNSIILYLFLAISAFSFSQNRQINFEHGNLASVLEKAKKENKLIFVDAYTSWCGPCKWMSNNIFTNDSVADYFNATFVNYKLDMEKGEGPAFAKKYEVNCYPNLVFINANGELVHRGAGGMQAQNFISFAKNSLDPETNFLAQKAAYESGALNENTIFDYVHLLAYSCLDPTERVSTYIHSVKEEDLLKRANWYLLRDYLTDINSREVQYFLKNTSAFEAKFGKDTVGNKVVQLGNFYFMRFAGPTFDKESFEKAKQEFIAMKWPQSDKILFDTELRLAKSFDKPKYYAMATESFLKYNSTNAGALNSVAWDFYENVSDKNQLKAAAKMAEQACAMYSNYEFLDTYAAVLYKSGSNKEAEKIALKAIEKAKEKKMAPEEYAETTALLSKIKAGSK